MQAESSNEIISHGLIIAEPWISKILRKEKTWEMRTTSTQHGRRIALIKKGSGKIYGEATIVDVIGPLTKEQLKKHIGCHQISEREIDGMIELKWKYAWVLDDVVEYEKPISYTHPNGAVIWVKLNNSFRESTNPALDASKSKNRKAPTSNEYSELASNGDKASSPHSAVSPRVGNSMFVPIARDGTCFNPTLCNGSGFYTVGEKSDERKFGNFQDALNYLRNMPAAKWRRPNPVGNWGIVSAVDWVNVEIGKLQK